MTHIFEARLNTKPSLILASEACVADGMLSRILGGEDLYRPIADWEARAARPVVTSLKAIHVLIDRVGQSIVGESGPNGRFTLVEVLSLTNYVGDHLPMLAAAEIYPKLHAALGRYLASIENEEHHELFGVAVRDVPWHEPTHVTLPGIHSALDVAAAAVLSDGQLKTFGVLTGLLDDFFARVVDAMHQL